MTCVVVPTDDGKKVKVGHFGDAGKYLFFNLEEETLVDEVPNPYKDEEGHGVEEKRKKIFELIKECDVIVYTFFGPGGEEFMRKRGKVPVRVEPGTTVEEALKIVKRALTASSS